MTILVTGANGYLGNLIVKGLVAKGKTVRAMVRDEEKTRIRLGALADKIEVIKGDVTDRASLTPLSSLRARTRACPRAPSLRHVRAALSPRHIGC